MRSIRIVMLVATLATLAGSASAGGAAQAPVLVTFRLEDAATAVRRVVVFEAQGDLATPAVATVPLSEAVSAAFVPGRDVVVQLELDDGAYLLDGPFRWPSEPAVHQIAHLPRRTVAGTLPSRVALDRPIWVDAHGLVSAEQWPQCGASERMWACVGVPADEGGLAVFGTDHPARFAHVPARGAPVMQTAAWATVVVVAHGVDRDLVPPQSRGRVSLHLWRSADQLVSTSAARITPSSASGCRVLPLSPDVFVVACNNDENVDVQVKLTGAAMTRTTIDPLSTWLLSPITVDLTPEIVVVGRVEARQGRPAPGARIDISELFEVTDKDGKARMMRRSIVDAEAAADGRFEVRGLGPGQYEALAAHARLGRGRVRFEPDSRPLIVRLAPTTRVVGRVVRGGAPVVGATVDAPPDQAVYLKAADPFDVITPETATGADGRFELSLAPGGAFEVRIVRDRVTVRRRLGRTTAAQVDLGDIEWPSSVAVSLEYVGDERCTLVAVGPFGRSGITSVEATIVAPGARRFLLPEPGRWVLAAKCGARELPVQPGIIEIPADVSEWRAHVIVPP